VSENPYQPPQEANTALRRGRRPHWFGVLFWTLFVVGYSLLGVWFANDYREHGFPGDGVSPFATLAMRIGTVAFALLCSLFCLWRAWRWYPPQQ